MKIITTITLKKTPEPHKAANGKYSIGESLPGDWNPLVYYNADKSYCIAKFGNGQYALYNIQNGGPYNDADMEIWKFGEDGSGPVIAGLLEEPFPKLSVKYGKV